MSIVLKNSNDLFCKDLEVGQTYIICAVNRNTGEIWFKTPCGYPRHNQLFEEDCKGCQQLKDQLKRKTSES